MIHHHVMWTDGEPLIRWVVRTYAIVREYMAQRGTVGKTEKENATASDTRPVDRQYTRKRRGRKGSAAPDCQKNTPCRLGRKELGNPSVNQSRAQQIKSGTYIAPNPAAKASAPHASDLRSGGS